MDNLYVNFASSPTDPSFCLPLSQSIHPRRRRLTRVSWEVAGTSFSPCPTGNHRGAAVPVCCCNVAKMHIAQLQTTCRLIFPLPHPARTPHVWHCSLASSARLYYCHKCRRQCQLQWALGRAFIYSIFDIIAFASRMHPRPLLGWSSHPSRGQRVQLWSEESTVVALPPRRGPRVGRGEWHEPRGGRSQLQRARHPSSLFNLLPKHELLFINRKKLISIREIGFLWMCLDCGVVGRWLVGWRCCGSCSSSVHRLC